MGSVIKQWRPVFALLLISNLQHYCIDGAPQVPCYFIFGDSLSDNGNNNLLVTIAKANYRPYGIDFQDGSTGRFTNGRTIPDIIAELLGFETRIQPFAMARGIDILSGVNYASGAAGIRDETGSQLGTCISLNWQLLNHQTTIGRLIAMQGSSAASSHLNKCLYTIGIGSNDYLNNYYLPDSYPTSRLFNPEQYARVLIQQYSQQLQTLYDRGARKVALFAAGQIGCIPNSISNYGKNGTSCVESMNTAANFFNIELKSLVDQLNSNLIDAKFTYINPMLPRPDQLVSLGFRAFTTGCCQVTRLGQCIPGQMPCSNRGEYIFWDSFHPTEAVNVIMADLSYSAANPLVAHPYNVSRLAQM